MPHPPPGPPPRFHPYRGGLIACAAGVVLLIGESQLWLRYPATPLLWVVPALVGLAALAGGVLWLTLVVTAIAAARVTAAHRNRHPGRTRL